MKEFKRKVATGVLVVLGIGGVLVLYGLVCAVGAVMALGSPSTSVAGERRGF